jgi:hypothetical protein
MRVTGQIRIILTAILLVLSRPGSVFPADMTSDQQSLKTADILNYGIESEIMQLLKDLGTNPRSDLYPKLLERYSGAMSVDTKVAFIDFFALCKNAPQAVVDRMYSDASSDMLDRRLETSLDSCIGSIGKKREGELLLKKLDSDDVFIKGIVADSLSKMKVPELAQEILKRIEDSDKIEDKYLEPEIKSKLVLFFGENKSPEAVPFLKKVISDKASDKYMVMYSMVSLLKIGDTSSIKLISDNLGSENVKIKEYAAYSISLFKNAEALPYLRKMLLDSNENIRVCGCQGIALNEDVDSVQVVLYKFKNDPSMKVRNEALVTLVNLGQKGIDAVKDTLKGQKLSESMLAYLCDSVAKKPNAKSVEYLVNLFNVGDKNQKDLIVKYSTNAVSNLSDPLILLFLNSDNYLHRIYGIKLAYQVQNSTLLTKIGDIAANDKVQMVRDNAKKILDMKK